MTEIPEHLLKRSRERRAALGLGDDAPAPVEGEAASSTPVPTEAAATPAPAAAATPAPVEEPKPEPPKPVPAYVQAAYKRRRVPYWAMPVLAAIPLWGYVFYGTLEPAPLENDPLTVGEEIYSTGGCAGCHGADGGGVTGGAPGFTEGHVQETWSDYRDHMIWVRIGADGWPGTSYGDDNTRPEVSGAMPANAGLTDAELASVVLYERRVLGNEEAPEGEEDILMQIALGELTFAEAELGPAATAAGIPESDLEGGG